MVGKVESDGSEGSAARHGRWWWRPFGGSVLVAVGLLAAMVAVAYLVPLPERLQAEDSTVIEWRDGTVAHVFLSEDDRWRMPADLEDMDPRYVRAVLAVEDEHYWWHPGVDPLAVVRAAWSNLVHGRVVSGASTVTMQLVRLLEPRPRTFRSKVIEAFRAVQLELRLSKREILEAYLSYVPYGRNYEGVETASYLYFDTSPQRLSPAQMATLIAVPQAPGGRFPSRSNRERLRDARKEILRELARDGVFAGSGVSASPSKLVAQNEERAMPRRINPLPDAVPHAARWLVATHPEERRIETTLDKDIQDAVVSQFDDRRASLQSRDIHNGAGVVVEHATGAVRALVGNFDFFDRRHGGQIPGFAVPRSTGSLLKPFLYAMGIDRGLTAPKHLVTDVPTSFGGFRPQNFNESYAGLIRMESALSQSKNIPFVRLAEKLGVQTFLTELRRLGVDGFQRPPTDYGISVAVGGLALTPIDVATLYAAMARAGRSADVHVVKEAIPERLEEPPNQVLTPGSTWLTNRALRKRDRPDFPVRRRATNVPTGLHWKTGTSARNRDAWSAGFGPSYTAAVWLGNFDNSRSPALIGSEAAGPLYFDVLEAIESSPNRFDEEAPEGLTKVEVCALSGHLPTEACPGREKAWMVASNVATERCPYHVQRAVSPQTGLAVPPGCDADLETKTKSYVQIPSGAARWMGQRFGQISQPPRLHPECGGGSAASVASAPTITWPPVYHEVVLLRMLPRSDQQIPLEAETAAGGATLHWYVDGEFIASEPADSKVWWEPSPGKHEIVVMDAAGRSDSRKIHVRWRGEESQRVTQ